MNKYKELQDFIIKCIALGWEERAINPSNFYCDIHGVNIRPVSNEDYISYHDLFSKDSGLMEFVEWKPTISFGEGNLKVRYNEMSDMTSEEKLDYFLANALVPQTN